MTRSVPLKAKLSTARPVPRADPLNAARFWSAPDQFTDDASGRGWPAAYAVRKPALAVWVAASL